jgi:hypothetical protein
MEAGMVRLSHLIVDGSKVEANNSRKQTKASADIEEILRQLDARIEKVMAEAETVDQAEEALFGAGATPNRLPPELKDLRKQQAKLKQALEKVKAKAQRAMETEGLSAEKAAEKRVPITDVDSEIMKNKQGGFGPNLTPYLGMDGSGGVIVAEGVTNSQRDDDHLQPAIEEAQANTGKKVVQVQADADYATPTNLTYCEEEGIDPCIAPQNTNLEDGPGSAESMPWPKGVPETALHAEGCVVHGASIPRNHEGRLDKSAFRYDPSRDVYVCPTGQPLTPRGRSAYKRSGRTVFCTVYRGSACRACPFAGACTNDPKGRTVKRREDEAIHERQGERMRDPQRRRDYRLRKQTVEPAFGILKEVLRLRRFLLRGLEYVRAEWSLACAAFNIKRLVAVLRPIRLPGPEGAIAG